MTHSDTPDPAIVEHVILIRDRFGLDGLREAQHQITQEIARAEAAYDALEQSDLQPPGSPDVTGASTHLRAGEAGR